MSVMTARDYVSAHGPRAGDRIRLGDTGLIVRVESDAQAPGDEFLAGPGRTARDGQHLRPAPVRDTCDLVISNVLVIDAVQGVRKASIGVTGGRIASIGRAGNPDTLDGVEVVVGTGTTIVPGEGLIATAGAVDTHVHLLAPRVLEAALASGVTTVIGQDPGPVGGTGPTPPRALRNAYGAFDAWPVNIGFLARSSSSAQASSEALTEGGACGLSVHGRTGTHPRVLDTALRAAEEYDVQVALHPDGLHECLATEDTLRVLDGRTVFASHGEGCGSGHLPGALELAGAPNVIGSSALSHGRDSLAEHLGTVAAGHGARAESTGGAATVRERVRAGVLGAEGVLHDLGVIGITASGAQSTGRAGETVRRTFALAGLMKRQLGPLEGGFGTTESGDDNLRVLRYLAKLTVNPAIAHGLAHEVGSIEVGKLADLVLWRPDHFGAVPELVLKAGFPAHGVTGDPIAAAELSVAFTARAAVEGGDAPRTRRRRVAVHGTRGIGPADLVRNTRTGTVRVAPTTGAVSLDGTLLDHTPPDHAQPDHTSPTPAPAEAVPLSRLYFL
ncbi:urease subunit alpha [Kitasatospora sp. NPDC096147]|uniref:urease subunit alpha n=1 Tax=Kitasatospora sp. NPDC096147 TaxID=3364093 RepID=UPI0038235341